MKNSIKIQARRFLVTIRDERTGEIIKDAIILDKTQLQAAQMVGQSSTELICRIYNREGYKVLDIDTPEKREISVDLAALWPADPEQHAPIQSGR